MTDLAAFTENFLSSCNRAAAARYAAPQQPAAAAPAPTRTAWPRIDPTPQNARRIWVDEAYYPDHAGHIFARLDGSLIYALCPRCHLRVWQFELDEDVNRDRRRCRDITSCDAEPYCEYCGAEQPDEGRIDDWCEDREREDGDRA